MRDISVHAISDAAVNIIIDSFYRVFFSNKEEKLYHVSAYYCSIHTY